MCCVNIFAVNVSSFVKVAIDKPQEMKNTMKNRVKVPNLYFVIASPDTGTDRAAQLLVVYPALMLSCRIMGRSVEIGLYCTSGKVKNAIAILKMHANRSLIWRRNGCNGC